MSPHLRFLILLLNLKSCLLSHPVVATCFLGQQFFMQETVKYRELTFTVIIILLIHFRLVIFVVVSGFHLNKGGK